MDKQIEIEELARDIGESLGITYEGEQVPFRLKTRNYLAKELVNKGYRNCKDKVGLTMEEFDEFRKDRAEVIFLKKQIIEQARKEAIERFIVEMKASETLSTLLNAGWETFYKMICNDMYELARQYGVEIEEEV